MFTCSEYMFSVSFEDLTTIMCLKTLTDLSAGNEDTVSSL
jgi:hypothetical protein